MTIARKSILFLLLLMSANAAQAQSTCIQDGGTQLCSEATYSYSLCDYEGSFCGTYKNWCEAHGGIWDAPNGCGGSVQCHNAAKLDDGNMASISEDFFKRNSGAGSCPIQKQDSGWGASWVDHDVCWTVGPTYIDGVETLNGRIFTYSGTTSQSSCQTQTGLTVIGRRDRNTCPPGYETSGMKCIKTPDATCPVGHPSQPASGNKKLTETDIAAPRSGGLEFVRTYNSFGYYVPPGAATAWQGILGRNWRSTYDKRIFPLAGSAFVMAVAWRDDGTVKHFSSSGLEVPARVGVADRLAKKFSGSVQVGWIYTTSNDDVEEYSLAGKLTSVTDVNGRKTSLSYDTKGFLHKATDSFGRTLIFDVQQGRLLTLTMSDGSEYNYAYYDGTDVLRSVQYPGTSQPREFIYGSTNSADLTGINDESLSRYATYIYDESGRVYQSFLGSDNVDDGLEKFQFAYGSGSTVVTTPSNDSATYETTEVNGVSRIASVSTLCAQCGQDAQSHTYYATGDVETTTDFKGSMTTFAYETRGHINLKIEASNDTTGSKRTIQTDWNPGFNLPTERRTYDASNGLVAKSSWSYNTRGQSLTSTRTDPATSAERTTTTTYCEQSDVTAGTCPLIGLVKVINGPRIDVVDTTSYTYYASDDPSCATAPATCPHRKGDLWKATNALGHVTETLTYDGAGRALSVKDSSGVITDLEYYPRGWLTARKVRGTNNAVETDDQITRIDYWPTGLVKKITQPDGAFTSYAYDAAHRLSDITDNAGNTLHYTLDNAGNRVQEDTKDTGGTLKRTLSWVYNQLGQLATQADADANPTDFSYDANGNADTITDALSHVTDNDYDPFNRLAKTLQDVGGVAAETKFAYNALDNLTKVTDPKGLDTTYAYNGLGDLTQLASPDTGTTSYTYDSAGNRATQTDARGVMTSYGYDALNRLVSVGYSDGTADITYGYDAGSATACQRVGATVSFTKGRLTRITDVTGFTEYCYDRFGNMLGKSQSGSQIFNVRYGYAPSGQLKNITYPGGAVVDYVYDTQARISAIGVTPSGGVREVLLRTVRYAPFGPITGWTWNNGRTMERSLDLDYRPAKVFDGASGGLSLGYEFNEVGNLVQIKDGLLATQLARYDYDALNRLTVTKDGPTGTPIETYGYDATGNRSSLTNSGGTATYSYPTGNHRLSAIGATVRGYDLTGNTTSIGTARQFVYDGASRMKQAKQSGAVVMNYRYNGKGEQTRKFPGDATTTSIYTVYDEAGHWMGDYNSSGIPIQQAVWLGDLPVGLLVGASSSQKLHYIEPDHLGTPRVVIDPTRDVTVWAWDAKSEAFGNSPPNQNLDGDATNFVFNMRYPGQHYDAASGLNYNYFRDYEPGTGRYTESDPIGLFGGINSYAYVGNSPLRWADSSGLVRQLDPNGEECMALARKIENIKRALDEKWREYNENPLKLPEHVPGGKPRESREGHLGLIRGLQEALDANQALYAAKCGGTPQNCPDHSEEDLNDPAQSMSPGAKIAFYGGIGLLFVGTLIFGN